MAEGYHMFARLSYQLRLRKLQRKRDDCNARFTPKKNSLKINGLTNNSNQQQILELEKERAKNEDELLDFRSKYLQRTAERLLISVPPQSISPSSWEHSLIRVRIPRLTLEAQNKLQGEIRAEEAARRFRLLQWTPVLFGAIGAITGLVAVIEKAPK